MAPSQPPSRRRPPSRLSRTWKRSVWGWDVETFVAPLTFPRRGMGRRLQNVSTYRHACTWKRFHVQACRYVETFCNLLPMPRRGNVNGATNVSTSQPQTERFHVRESRLGGRLRLGGWEGAKSAVSAAKSAVSAAKSGGHGRAGHFQKSKSHYAVYEKSAVSHRHFFV